MSNVIAVVFERQPVPPPSPDEYAIGFIAGRMAHAFGWDDDRALRAVRAAVAADKKEAAVEVTA